MRTNSGFPRDRSAAAVMLSAAEGDAARCHKLCRCRLPLLFGPARAWVAGHDADVFSSEDGNRKGDPATFRDVWHEQNYGALSPCRGSTTCSISSKE